MADPVVAMVACFKPQKAPLDFVKIARLVIDEHEQVEFLLVGDGVLRSNIKELAEELKISDKVHLAGWRKDVPEIMNSIEILVLTSLWEGLPRVLPQAMAAGVPVVASDVNGSREAIRDGVNGFIMEPHDIQGMARKILYLLKHPEVGAQHGGKGQRNGSASLIYGKCSSSRNCSIQALPAQIASRIAGNAYEEDCGKKSAFLPAGMRSSCFF